MTLKEIKELSSTMLTQYISNTRKELSLEKKETLNYDRIKSHLKHLIAEHKARNTEYVRFLLPRGTIVYLDETREVLEKDYYTTLALNKTSQKLYHIARRNLQQQIAKELHGIIPRMISIDSHDFKYQVQSKAIEQK